jgi:hypothetical protein
VTRETSLVRDEPAREPITMAKLFQSPGQRKILRKFGSNFCQIDLMIGVEISCQFYSFLTLTFAESATQSCTLQCNNFARS